MFRRGRKIKIVFCLDVPGLLGCFRFRFTYESSGIRTDGRAEDAPPRNYSFGKTAGLVYNRRILMYKKSSVRIHQWKLYVLFFEFIYVRKDRYF